MVSFPYARARLFAAALTAASAWAVFAPAAAAPPIQTGTPMQYGDTLSGEIHGDPACEYYWFEGGAGHPVTIDMARTSGSLDGVLALYRQDGNNFSADPIALNDDRPGGGLDPLISTTLPAADWYTIAACRLQAEQMRITTGTYTLSLTGPAAAEASAATPVPADNLSDSIFGGAGSSPDPTSSATPAGVLSDVIPAESSNTALPPATPANAMLADGSLVAGQLGGAVEVRYSLPVQADDMVRLEWRRVAGDAAPMLRVLDEQRVMLAEAATPDTVSQLDLRFRAPSDDLLLLIVARYEGVADGSTFDFELHVTVTPDEGSTALVLTPTPTSEGAGATPAASEEAAQCQSGGEAISGNASTDRLAGAYTAAGDSYNAADLDITTEFASDDDLNIVLSLQHLDGPVSVTGIFCSPDGASWDGGENRLDNGGPYLFGLDWESNGVLWPTGEWFAEVYVEGTLELTLGFTVG